jgi:hypothetical protein
MSSCPPWYCDQFSIATAGELIQSLPFDRLAGRMLAAAMPGAPGRNRGEDSMRGPLGDLISGNR